MKTKSRRLASSNNAVVYFGQKARLEGSPGAEPMD